MTIKVDYLKHSVSLNIGETVLEGLERAGAIVSSSCRAGACQFCMLRLVHGSVPKMTQENLRPSLRDTGHFLPCICKPTEDIRCEPAHTGIFQAFVNIQGIKRLGSDVALVRFERPESFDFKPGQFVTLSTAGGLSRSYSIASQATEETHFDIHVRRVNQGRFSTWFHDEAKAGDILWLEGPKGDCYYNPSDPHEPLTLIGTGTGIAPLYAIAIDALAQRHFGQITIYHGALTQDRLYFVDELKALDASYENISYLPCVVEGMTLDGIQVGELSDIVLNNLPEPKSQRVYLCGDPGIVRLLKKKIFLAGTSLAQIYSDPFVGTNSK